MQTECGGQWSEMRQDCENPRPVDGSPRYADLGRHGDLAAMIIWDVIAGEVENRRPEKVKADDWGRRRLTGG